MIHPEESCHLLLSMYMYLKSYFDASKRIVDSIKGW